MCGEEIDVVGNNVRQQLKLVVCKCYLTVHGFHASVQSPTCTTYAMVNISLGKHMPVLTPKLGIMTKKNQFSDFCNVMLCHLLLERAHTRTYFMKIQVLTEL